MTDQVRLDLVRFFEGDYRHSHFPGRNQHRRLVIDLDAGCGRVGCFLEEERVDPGIGLPDVRGVGEEAGDEPVQNRVGRFQGVDLILGVVRQVEQLVAGGLLAGR